MSVELYANENLAVSDPWPAVISSAAVTQFDIFFYFGVPLPSWKDKWLVFRLLKNNAEIFVEVLMFRNIISNKLASWCVYVDDDDVFKVWNEIGFDGNFRDRKALAWFPISNLQCSWKIFLWCFMHTFRCFCRTLTLSDAYQYLRTLFFSCGETMKSKPLCDLVLKKMTLWLPKDVW